jgi:hypothetical protein
MVGQIITGAGQPFFLNVPTHYSDKWFSATSRVSATALMSLANAIGAAVGQLVNPFLAPNAEDIPNMVLNLTIMLTAASVFRHNSYSSQCSGPVHTKHSSYSSCPIKYRAETSSQRGPPRPRTKPQLLVLIRSSMSFYDVELISSSRYI